MGLVWNYRGDICTWILGCHAEILLLQIESLGSEPSLFRDGTVWNYRGDICTCILGCHAEILLLQVESLEGEPPLFRDGPGVEL
jgi:hypothetical protein